MKIQRICKTCLKNDQSYKITLRFFRSRSLIGHIIRWRTRSDSSHIDTLISTTEAITAVGGTGVRVYPINFYEKKGYVQTAEVIFCVSEEQYVKYQTFLLSKEGSEYDKSGALAFIFNFLKQDEDKWFCSEIIIAALVYADIIYNIIPPEKWSPEDIKKASSFLLTCH